MTKVVDCQIEPVVLVASLKFFFIEGGEQFIVGTQTAKSIGLKPTLKITASITQRVTKLKTVLLLTSFYVVIQIIAAISTRSLALLSDAGHMFADAGGIALPFRNSRKEQWNYTRKDNFIIHNFYNI